MRFNNALVKSENISNKICKVLRKFKIIDEACIRYHNQLCFFFSIYIIAKIVVMGKRIVHLKLKKKFI